MLCVFKGKHNTHGPWCFADILASHNWKEFSAEASRKCLHLLVDSICSACGSKIFGPKIFRNAQHCPYKWFQLTILLPGTLKQSNGKIELWPLKSRHEDAVTIILVCLVIFTSDVQRSDMVPLGGLKTICLFRWTPIDCYWNVCCYCDLDRGQLIWLMNVG